MTLQLEHPTAAELRDFVLMTVLKEKNKSGVVSVRVQKARRADLERLIP